LEKKAESMTQQVDSVNLMSCKKKFEEFFVEEFGSMILWRLGF